VYSIPTLRKFRHFNDLRNWNERPEVGVPGSGPTVLDNNDDMMAFSGIHNRLPVYLGATLRYFLRDYNELQEVKTYRLNIHID